MDHNQNLDHQILILFRQLNDSGKAATIILMHRILGKDAPAKEELELLYPRLDYDWVAEVVEELLKSIV